MNTQTLAIIVTIILAFSGYLTVYLIQINLKKEHLDLVNKQLNLFYGSLYIVLMVFEN